MALSISFIVTVSLGVLSFMVMSSWMSLSTKTNMVPTRTVELLNARLTNLETAINRMSGQLDKIVTLSEEARQRGKAVVDILRQEQRQRDGVGGVSGVAGSVRVLIAVSTMRRGGAEEHIWATVDSAVAALGQEGMLHTTVLVMDVERGQGTFARDIQMRYGELVAAGLMHVKHMEDAERDKLYQRLQNTCGLHRLYGDDMTRTIWRSKRTLDFVHLIRTAVALGTDYVLVVEDDTPFVGSLPFGVLQCATMYPANSSTACRWDFHWERNVALNKVVGPESEAARSSPKVMYPQGELQGLFAVMLPSADWAKVAEYMYENFDKAPADWLLGRWLFQNNWRIAFMPPVLAIYHKQGANFGDSSRVAVSRSLASDPMFKDKPLEWSACRHTEEYTNHAFKWEDAAMFKLRWVGGSDLFLEVPWTDLEGLDIGVPRDAGLMDEDARIIVCAMTSDCKAVNIAGWMKHTLDAGALSTPERTKKLFIRVPAKATAQEVSTIRQFFIECLKKIPVGAVAGIPNNPV